MKDEVGMVLMMLVVVGLRLVVQDVLIAVDQH